jgi:hypothetical protein
VLAIQTSPGHDTPATNQYLPASGSGSTKTKLKGRVDWSALDSFNLQSGTADPISWLALVNNGAFIVKSARTRRGRVPRQISRSAPFSDIGPLGEDRVAERHALVADEHIGNDSMITETTRYNRSTVTSATQ